MGIGQLLPKLRPDEDEVFIDEVCAPCIRRLVTILPCRERVCVVVGRLATVISIPACRNYIGRYELWTFKCLGEPHVLPDIESYR